MDSMSQCEVTCMLPVKDMARARRFYEDRLGLEPLGVRPDGKFNYHVGGTTLALFPKPDGTKAEHTALSFKAERFEPADAFLKARGVKFADYDMPGLKTVMSACSARKRQRGSKTPKATSCACMKTWPDEPCHAGARHWQDRFNSPRLAARARPRCRKAHVDNQITGEF